MVTLSNWSEKNTATPPDSGSNPDYSGGTLAKVIAVKVTWNNVSSGTGAGDCEFTVDLTTEDELVVTQADETTVRPYQIAYFDATAEEAWLWVYGDWTLDGTDDIVVGAGGGDGTEYQWNGPYQDAGTGSNPWTQTGINSEFVYHLNEDSGTLFDSSGNGRDSTASAGGPTYDHSETQFGKAIDFDGVDDEFTIPDVDPGSEVTLVHWFKADSFDDNIAPTMVEQWSNTGGIGYATRLRNDSTVDFIITTDVAVESSSLSANTWYGLVMTGDASTAEGFIDGTSQGTDARTFDATGTVDARLGEDSEDGGRHLDGTLDAIRCYSEVKGADWIQAEQDMSPKGGQTFFSWGGAQDTTATAGSVRVTSTAVAQTTSGVVDTQT